MSEALFSDERVCDSCGKKFDVQRPDLWRYVRVSGRGQLKMWFCSWGCMRKFDLRKDEDEMVKHDRKQIAEEMIRLAGEGQITSPAKYMMSIGYKQPYQAFDTLKADLERHSPELYTRLMDALGDKGKPRERKARIETPETNKVEVVETPEGCSGLFHGTTGEKKAKAPCTKPLNYSGYEVSAIRRDELGEFYHDTKFNCVDWRTPAGDEVSLSPAGWRQLRDELPTILKILGVEV